MRAVLMVVANCEKLPLCPLPEKVQETALLQSGIAFRYRFLPSARLPGKAFRQRGLIDNRPALELEA
jgi:hypothetical protein